MRGEPDCRSMFDTYITLSSLDVTLSNQSTELLLFLIITLRRCKVGLIHFYQLFLRTVNVLMFIYMKYNLATKISCMRIMIDSGDPNKTSQFLPFISCVFVSSVPAAFSGSSSSVSLLRLLFPELGLALPAGGPERPRGHM